MCLFSFGQNNNFAELPMHYGGRAGAAEAGTVGLLRHEVRWEKND